MKQTKEFLDRIYKPIATGDCIIPVQLEDEYINFAMERHHLYGNWANATNKRVFFKKNLDRIYPIEYEYIHNLLYKKYIDDGIGIKLIARMIGYSYTETRSILNAFSIPMRKGYNVVTDNLRTIRSNKLKGEYAARIGWFSTFDRKNHHTQRGVCGFYFNMGRQKYVWLRSTWEYIYAKFLDKICADWDIEVTTFNVIGKTYRPDFFIYNDTLLEKIIEIKGFWKDKEWKTVELNKMLDIDVIVISDISIYIENGETYKSQLKEWKNKRILKL